MVSKILGAGFEKLLFFLLVSVMICHIFACLWVFCSQMVGENEPHWMEGDVEEMPANE